MKFNIAAPIHVMLFESRTAILHSDIYSIVVFRAVEGVLLQVSRISPKICHLKRIPSGQLCFVYELLGRTIAIFQANRIGVFFPDLNYVNGGFVAASSSVASTIFQYLEKCSKLVVKRTAV